MKGLLGENKHTIDAKGRMTMPSKFRTALGETVYITRGLDGCLDVLSEDGFEEFSNTLLASRKTTRNIRELQRQIYKNSHETTYDKSGRILIPQNLRDLANLEKEVMVVGVGNKVEIWNMDRWNSFEDLSDDEYADLYEDFMNQEEDN